MLADEYDQMRTELCQKVRGELARVRGAGWAWSYRRGQAPSVEPTAVACLGLVASGDPGSLSADLRVCHEAANWMISIAREDGSVPPSRELHTPGWPTPYAMLLWKGLGGYEAARRRAASWLLRLAGQSVPRAPGAHPVIGHDASLIGWPWIEQTHSWLEPTALAILAVCREGLGDHPRVRAGVALILDRALDDGGWNYGGKAVFGRTLRPQPGPTGLALLALAAVRVESEAISKAAAYLRATLPGIRSAVSLGWGVLGLRAHNACPADDIEWLNQSYERFAGRSDAALALSVLLLASGERSLELLGAQSASRPWNAGVSPEDAPGRPSSGNAAQLTSRASS
jgi:hypothetical protein